MLAARAAAAAAVALVFVGNRALVSPDGRTWREASPPRAPVDAAVFLDARHGWLAGADCTAGTGAVLRTVDGGRTWARARFGSHSCNAGARFSLDFVDERTGWIVQDEPTAPFARLYATRDGGATWTETRARLPTLGDVAFTTRRAGWLAGGGLFRTGDGGRTWRERRLAAPRGFPRVGPEVARPAFFGARGIVAAAWIDGSRVAVAVYASRDGGRAWRRVTTFRGRLGARIFDVVGLSAPAPRVAWVWADESAPRLWVTRDGGRSWTSRVLRFAGARMLQDVHAFDARTAVATTYVGDRAVAYVTRDGGATWRALR
jgi:photosystem II stability/assembly factor-like uncharacterized protein